MVNQVDKVDRVLSGLKAMGFDDVFEVAKGAEICAKAIAAELEKPGNRPVSYTHLKGGDWQGRALFH